MKKITSLLALLLVFCAWNVNAQITSYPYFEDFESGDGGWTVDGTGSWELGTPANTIINSADSGTNAWVTNLTGDYNTGEDTSVVSPVFDLSSLTAPSIEFSIWWNSENSWDGMVLQSSIDAGGSWQNVGGLGDPNNWYNDDTIAGNPGGQQIGWTGRDQTGNGSGGWVIARHALIGLGGESNVLFRFAFGSDGSVQDEGVAFDSINIFEVSCPEPTGITIDSFTDVSAEISWAAGGAETNWEIVVQAAGTGQPTGSGTPTTNNNPYSASGLTATTAYEVYVRSDCGGEFSSWVGPINFMTFNTPPPPPVGVTCTTGNSSFVFTAEFDTVDGWTGDLNGGDGTWEIPNDSGSGGTGADAAFSGGSFMNYESSGGTTDTASAVSPAIDLTSAVDGAELSFYMHAFGADMGTLNVGVATSQAGPFTNEFAWAGDLQTSGADPWVPIGINLDAYLGQVIYIEFSHTGTGDFEGDMSIDFVRVETCGSFCIAPSSIAISNIGGTDADLTWIGNNGETSWEYVVVPAGTGEPTGSGTITGTNSINLTGLAFSTDYEVWVRADCGGGVYSIWAGPVNFTTTIQSDFLIDCTQAPTNITYCYDNNDTTNWTFTSSDGSPIRITFNAGGIESCCDDILIYEGTDNTGALIYQGNNGGDLAGLTFDSIGDSMYFEIDSDGSVSCGSGSGCCTTEWDFTVACATCVNPSATYAVVSNCIVGPEFFIDVDLTDLGSATSITISDDQGSAGQTVSATGVVQFGPYPNNTPVVITVDNDDDANCQISSTPLTQELCLDTFVDCNGGPVPGFICYDNNDSVILTYTSTNGLPLNLNILDGIIEGAPFDFLLITDGDGTVLYNDEGNDGDLAGLSFQSITDTITLQILSDGSVSCTSGAFPDGINFTVACATCINPAATYQVVDDCANGDQFLIDVDVTTLGDATSLTITNNIDATTVPVTATGIYQIGPFPFLVDVVVTVSNDQDPNCIINSSAIQLLACPPTNDNPCNAIVAVVNTDSSCNLVTPGSLIEATPSGVPDGSCTGDPDDDVWFEFVAENEVQLISIINIAGGTFNIDHGLYEGTCDGLVELECTDGNASVSPELVVGNTYFIRVFSGGSASETSTFDLCIKDAPTNIICENAENFCEDGGALTTSNIIGIPDPNDIACLGTAPNPTWNIIQIGDPGLIEIQIDQVDDDGNGLDVDFVLWGPFVSVEDACLNIAFEDCPTCPNNTTNPAFYPFGNIVDCSYSAAPTENLTINNAMTGEIYMLLVTNFSDDPGTISIFQTNGGDATDGSVTAEIQVDLGQDQELCGFPSYDIIADSPFADRFEWYCDGFIIVGEESGTLTVTDSCTYTVIAFDDQCQSQAQDEVTITFGAEPVANLVPDIVTCDDISGDGIEDFDLEIQTADILGGQNPADFNVTYHLTLAEAQQGINALTSPYTNISNPQTIYVRVEDANATFCFATASFQLDISGPTPTATTDTYPECDDDQDGIAAFDLPSRDANILGGQSAADFTVTYYTSLADAEAGTGAIDTSMLYNSPTATIFVRVESNLAFDCYATTTMDLVVNQTPDDSFVLMDLITCDDASADGIEDFDLESQTATILGTQNPADFNVTYHITLADAQAGTGALTSPYTNITNPQTIYIRVENANATECSITASFQIEISGPTPNATSDLYPECDDDFDGIAAFDLASRDANILGGQSAADFTVTYYESQADADAGNNAIDTSSFYNSASATIFVRVESNIAFDCYSTTTIELLVDPLPDTSFATNFDYEVCPNATTPILIEATANNYNESEVSINWYYEGGLISGENGLTLPVTDAGLYEIEVTFNLTQCTSSVSQMVIELPNCVIPQGISPNGDGKNDTFDLSSYDVTKLEIFNRNGTLVYSKTNYNNEWYGQSDDGDELPVGTYFYVMEYDNGKRRTAWVYIQRLN